MASYIKSFFVKITKPTSQNEDRARREFILNVLLLATIGLSFIAFIINLFRGLMDLSSAMPAAATFVIFSFFAFLYFLSRKGFSLLTSIIFLGIFFLLNSYTAIKYGVDVPEGLLVYALIIIMSGILVNTRFAFLVTFITATVMLIFGYLQIHQISDFKSSWREGQPLNMANLILMAVVFSIIVIVSWLSNREIEKSLKRARKSETELKKERDMLEIIVEERTKELKETQTEKMEQLYRFAEFGKISSGLFHDLLNPLNAVSLNMEKVKSSNETSGYVDRAISAAKKLENLVTSVRKQLRREENQALFSLNEETENVIDVLSHKAEKAGVSISFSSQSDIKIFGDAVRFNQIALNLIANAIDSYAESSGKHEKTIKISLSEVADKIIFKITDHGMGIPEKSINKIFEPFFTTKTENHGIGLGLSITKHIVEKDFGGDIRVSSKVGDETVFTVEIPNKNE